MLIKIFMLSGGLFALFLAMYRIVMNKIKNHTIKPNIVASISFFFAAYIISGILIFIFNPYKFLYLIFALTPFIIGKIANYKYEKFYTILQILIIVYSVVYAVEDLKILWKS